MVRLEPAARMLESRIRAVSFAPRGVCRYRSGMSDTSTTGPTKTEEEIKQVTERVQKLVSLAADKSGDGDDGPSNEARNAAIQAVRLMSENKLIMIDQKSLESLGRKLRDAQQALAREKQKNGKDKVQNMIIGAVAGAVVGPKLGFFRAGR